MNVNQKINSKFNKFRYPIKPDADGIEARNHRYAMMIKRGYTGLGDLWDSERILYRQDQKTNEREPPEPDGECFRGNEAANFEREQMAYIQRFLK